MLIYVESNGPCAPSLVVNNGQVSMALMPESPAISHHDVAHAERLFACTRDYLVRVYLARQEQLADARCRLPPAEDDQRSWGACRPLVITADTELLDELLRLAGAAGVELEVSADPAAARQRPAPLVLIGLDIAQAGWHLDSLPDLPELVLVGCSAPATEPPSQLADQLGAARIAMLPEAEPWLVDRFALVATEPAP